MNNCSIADKLLHHAHALESNGHNLYRIRAYRKAEALVRMLPVELEELVREGGRPALPCRLSPRRAPSAIKKFTAVASPRT